jgi:trans-2,3-dihydro-3-hydroxyanthranilate isomerase
LAPVNGSSELFPGTGADGTLEYTVFTDGRDLEAEEMQRLARELNLSESVFLLPAESDGDCRLRIFTPGQELPFAGHPVLGTAFVVAEALRTGSVKLETGRGTIPVDLQRDGLRISFGWMRQPIPTVEPYEKAEALLAALGLRRSELPVDAYDNGPVHAYVALATAAELAALKPDMNALAGLAVNAYCCAGDGDTWKARMFAPAMGVQEDPATGSGAGPLALHLARHGRIDFGQEIVIRQGVEIGRPSRLHARVAGSSEAVERIEVGGAAVVVGRGTFLVRSARRK